MRREKEREGVCMRRVNKYEKRKGKRGCVYEEGE